MFRDDQGQMVGRCYVDFEVANHNDMLLAQQGSLARGKVRRQKLRGLADSHGPMRMVLPASLAKKLGLPVMRKERVRDANRRLIARDIVGIVYVRLLGRSGVFTAAVEAQRRTALVGRMVLTELDFIFDPSGERLLPRDSEFVTCEL